MKFSPSSILFLIFFAFLSNNAFAQGGTCEFIEPFCSGGQGLIFPNCNNNDPSCVLAAEPGPDYGCLGSEPYPAWFYLQIDQPGVLEFDIVQNTSFDGSGNPTGTGLDVDFIAWGPFAQGDDLCDYTQLQAFNEIGCSYSIDFIESFTIPNGQVGEIYVLLITNFSQNEGFIQLIQTNVGSSGAGITDCSIIAADEGCEGDIFTLDGTTTGATNYEWQYDDGLGGGFVTIFNGNFPTIDVTLDGQYQVIVSPTNLTIPFDITVYPNPIITSPALDIFQCDNGVNTGIFDLTSNTPVLMGAQDPLVFQVKYYETLLDSQNDTNEIPTPAAYPIAFPPQQTVYVRIEEISGGICFDLDEFIIDFSPISIGVMTDFVACDTDADGFVDIDLITIKDSEALNGLDPLEYTVTYHSSQANADNDVGAFSNPYTVTAPSETIFVRVENNASPNCFSTDDFIVTVTLSPIAVVPVDYVLCDVVPNDGFAEFDLTTKDAEITGGDPNAVVFYYTTLAGANTGLFPIATPATYTNTNPGFETIYARVENINNSDCYDIVPLVLQVDQAPSITAPIMDYFLCDDISGDGIEVFDLLSKNAEILNTLLGVTLGYYETEQDAIDGVNIIPNPVTYSNTSNPQIIWVRAENSATCVTVGNFNLIVGGVGSYTEVPLFEQCDDAVVDGFTEFDLNSQDTIITGGDATLNVTYHPSQLDADLGINPLTIPYTNIVNPEIIYVRVENNTNGCSTVFEMTLSVLAPPTIFMPSPLEYCDPDNDGFGEFTLEDADSEVTGGVPTGNLQVTYHYLLADAENGVNPLASPYLNDIPYNQTVYVRLLDQATTCYNVTTLELIVLDTPQVIQPSDLTLCDDDGDGISIFDLTQSEPELLNGLDPALYTISYFEDINLSVPIANPTAYSNTPPSPQTIYILIEDIANGCTSQTTLLLWVYLPPVLIAPTPIELCDLTEIDGPDDEKENFDLDSKIDEITGGDLTIDITFYETQADADAGTNPLSSPYVNTNNPQTVFIRAEDINTLCVESLGVTLDLVVNPLPSPVTPTPLEVCDENNDGFAAFTLIDKDIEIIGGEPGVVISYHENLLDAEAGINALLSPYNNIVTYSQIIYARAEYPLPPVGTGTGCYRVVELELKTNATPIIPIDLPDLVECDDDEFAIFDLTQQAVVIYGAQDPADYALTYYTSLADAEAGTNAIATPTAFSNTTNPQTIWVQLEDNTTACIKVGSFDLVVELNPTFTVVTPFEQCDDEVQDGITAFDLNTQNIAITGADPDLGVTYYGNQVDADSASNPLAIPYTNTTNPETIYVRVENSTTGCYGTFPMELVVVPAPTILTPTPLEYCDPDNDGFGEFILTDADLEVTGGIPTGNLQVTYHYLLADAQNGVLPLPVNPYLNDVAYLQTIYVRLVDQSTGCYNTTSLDLIVLDSPQIITPTDLFMCDEDGDLIEVFDLTLVEPELLNGIDPTSVTISYYEDAALTIAIANPGAYTNTPPSPQIIYIVVEDNVNGCQSESTVQLWVDAAPVLVSPTPLEACDMTEIDGPDDEKEPFDLESKTDEITGGVPSVGITYYETQADADAGTNPLSSPYINTSNPQTIYIRAEDQNTNCIVSQGITLSLVVNPLPSPVTPTPLEVCDIDNDGFAAFILTDKDAEIIGGEPGVQISYYETLLDAEAGAFGLTSPYTNISTPTQIIYARAEYPLPPVGTGTGCWRVIELELIINPTPIIPIAIDDLVICDDDGDGFSIFDLTQREDDIYGTQDPADYTLTYHTAQLDADTGANPIATPEAFPNTINPQTIWVRLEDNVTACIKVGSFDIKSEIGPAVIQPEPLTLCDDLGEPNDGVTLFDLTQKNLEITAGAPGLTVSYYETQADAASDSNVITPDTAYENTSNPQVLWVRVTDVNTLCYDVSVNLTLRVTANPVPEDPDPIIFCDVTNPGDGQEVFDLTIRESQILDGETWDLSYYNSYEDAVANNAAIVTPGAYTNTMSPELIYVRASIDIADAASCFEIVTLELIVNPIPDDNGVVAPYIICEIPGDGQAIFDLTNKIDLLLNGQDPTVFQVSFYESQAEADSMLNPIQNPETYQNISNPQTIYVVIQNLDTGCFVSTQSFEIEEREGAIANTPLDPYTICDYYQDNDGIAEFDLADPDLLAEILGTQSPLVYQLDFYGTLDNAETETLALAINYVNIINPQIIYARVTNINTGCYDITEIILKVELIPEVTLEEFYRLCIDAQGNPIPGEEGEAPSPPVIDTGLDPSIYLFEWQLNGETILGEIGASITAIQEGSYSVIVTEITTGCNATATTTVTVSSPPDTYSAEVISGAFADQHNIVAEASGISTYVFSLDDGPYQETGYFNDVEAGVHIVTIKDVNGCGSVSIELGVIDYPLFMTPNADGYHDTWNIIGIAAGDPRAKIYIFDRFGKLLKQLSPLGEGWDGTYNGNPLPSSDYWFRIEYTENDTKKEFRGHFTLKR